MSIPIFPDQVQTDPAAATKPRRTRPRTKAAGGFEKQVFGYLASELDDDRIEQPRNGAITGVRTIRGGRVVVECRNSTVLDLRAWLRDAEFDRRADGAVAGVVAHKRRGTTDPGEQFVTMPLAAFVALLEGGPDL